MKSIKENEFLHGLCKEFKLKLPKNLETRTIYHEIENFQDFEYTYCIAYEMLIRTDEYDSLLSKYNKLMDKNKNIPQTEKTAQLDNLITQMNQLGLNKNSFIGFDCGEGNVFEKIKAYDEIANSPWSVRTLDKFVLTSNSNFENVLDQLISFYYEKKELYIIANEKATEKEYIRTDIHPRGTFGIDHKIFIPCVDQDTNTTTYKSLTDKIYLKELDVNFLSIIKEENDKSILKQIKLDYKVTIDFWYQYTLNDVKYGIDALIAYYINNDKIQRVQNTNQDKITFSEVIRYPSDFFIPAIDRSSIPNKHTIMQITQNLPLRFLEDTFLSKLEFADLKGGYIQTEPILSRPRLLFDEARLINVPINLNLSKEELLLYISQIKDDYDRNKNIVKSALEYFSDLTLECELAEMPIYIKPAHETRDSKDKKLLPKKRQDFKKSLAYAFYIYDIYKFFVHHFEKEKKIIINERGLEIEKLKDPENSDNINHEKIEDLKDIVDKKLNNYEKNNLITQISYLVDDNLTEERVKYYLATMKEFIHGINKEGENHRLKRQHDPEKKENTKSKYKNLIVGDSFIIKSNKPDLVKILIG